MIILLILYNKYSSLQKIAPSKSSIRAIYFLAFRYLPIILFYI